MSYHINYLDNNTSRLDTNYLFSQINHTWLIMLFLHCSFTIHSKKKKVFYETKKGSSPCHAGRSFFGFAKRKFRMKLLLGEWEKWFRIKGSVRNLYRKKSKRFRTHGFVPNPYRIMSKRFRTDGFALNPFRIMSKRFRTRDVHGGATAATVALAVR